MKTVDIASSVITNGIKVMEDDSARFRNDSNFKCWTVKTSPWSDLTLSDGLVAKHSEPFNLHTDTFHATNKTNIIIPLEMEGSQSLLVFDQTYDNSAVWIAAGDTNRTRDSDPKNIIVGPPKDTSGVSGLTGKAVPSDLESYLIHDKDFYFGLSGTNWTWEIGKGGIFSSNQIHGTGNMNSKTKTTMTLWFNNTIDEVYDCISS